MSAVRALLCIVALWAAVPAWAGSIRANVDRTTAGVGERITLQVTVEGNGGAPRLPALNGFDAFSIGTSSEHRWVNGQATSATVYHYALVPQAEGTYTIGPVSAVFGAEVARTDPIRIQVGEAGEKPKPAGQEIFVTATVSDTEPWVGEALTYTFRLYTRLRTGGANLHLPDFDGFATKDLGEQRESERTVNGQAFVVTEITKSLVPQSVGSFDLPAAELEVDVVVAGPRRRSPFGFLLGGSTTERRVLRSKPTTVTVRALPPAPADFSGLVGTFSLTAELSRHELAVGESTTLTTRISGTGNVGVIPRPASEPPGPDFKTYEDKPTGKVDTRGSKLKGHRQWQTSLVPLRAGELIVPQQTLVWFDPGKESYRTARSGPFTLDVSPSEGGEELALTEGRIPGTGKVAVQVLGSDILPSYRRSDAVRTGPAPAVFGAALGLPPLVFLGLWWRRRRADAHAADSGLRRRQTASKRARKALATITGEPAEAAAIASRLLRTWVGDKLGREGAALTPDEAAGSLAAAGTEPELCERVRAALALWEAVQFGAATTQTAAIRDECTVLLTALERGLR